MSKKKSAIAATVAKISQSEWEVMQVLWNADAPLRASAVSAQLEGQTNWNPKTVRTFLNRLVRKQAINAVKLGAPGLELLHYVPLIDKATALQAKQETFAGRFFGGTIHSMLAGCIQSGDISVDELKQLREMIDRQVQEQMP